MMFVAAAICSLLMLTNQGVESFSIMASSSSSHPHVVRSGRKNGMMMMGKWVDSKVSEVLSCLGRLLSDEESDNPSSSSYHV